MNLRQAAQQALETLRWNYKTDLDNIQACEQWVDMLTETVAALENALLTDVTPAQVAHADAVAEPVAWMQEMPVSGNEERSVRMTTVKMVADEWDNPIPLYLAPTPQPEREPVAWRLYKDGQLYSIKFEKEDRGPSYTWEPLYTAPTPQREHSTDGSPCWCNPDVIEEDGGNVIVHNYDDNWQQYAKPGETAQQCIERHRAEQDALMKLYATPLRPLTDEQCDSILLALDEWAKRFDHYDYGLPLYNEELRVKAREVVRIAHGITGETK